MAQASAQQAINAFVQATKELSGGQRASKEVRERKAAAKGMIIQFMKEQKMDFIEVDGLFLVLKKKKSKPPINDQFLGRGYKEFHSNQNHLQGTIDEVSLRFGQFIFFMQKKLSVETHDVVLTKRKPLTAVLFDEFNFNP